MREKHLRELAALADDATRMLGRIDQICKLVEDMHDDIVQLEDGLANLYNQVNEERYHERK